MNIGDIVHAYVGAFGITVAEVSAVSGDVVSISQENYPPDDAAALQKLAEFEARPTLSLPASYSLGVGASWVISPLPNGTKIRTDGVEVGEVDDGEAVISFPEAGGWRLVLLPPYPHLPAECEVTVA